MGKKRKIVRGLPVSPATHNLLLDTLKAAHEVIIKLDKAARADNVFGATMARNAAKPTMSNYMRLCKQIEEEYFKWSANTGLAPAMVSRVLSQSEATAEGSEAIDPVVEEEESE